MDRGCRDISGVIGPLAEGAEVSDDGRIADDESSRIGIGVAFLHAVYTSVQMLELRSKNRHFSPLLGTFGVPSTRDGSLRKPFSSQQIGTEMSPSGRSENLVAEGSPKLPYQLPLIVHYLRWLTIAPEPHECYATPRLTRKHKWSADDHGERWKSKIRRKITIRIRMRIEPHAWS